jgi:hypothetical protein
VVGPGWTEVTTESVVPSSLVSAADLAPIAKVNAAGDPLYALKDKPHPFYKEFYADYLKSFPTWKDMEDSYAPAAPASYEQFLSARPLFFWKDPSGRLVRFVNTQFVVPNAAVPLVYLYPPQKENGQIALGENIAITNSYPAYHDDWLVSAQPDGELTDLRTGAKSPYLFWEGHPYILPPETKGFVVNSSDISTFFEATLPKLGLNARESADFISAWSPRLNAAPYYFITFVDKSVIDRFYPLQISPPPDTVIRVLMDFVPLYKRVSVPPLSLASPPVRRGFIVVKWGALVR